MRRDRLTFAMMLGIPIMQMILFGFAINSDPRHLPTALLTADNSVYSRTIVAAMQNSGYFRIVRTVASEAEGQKLIDTGEVQFRAEHPRTFRPPPGAWRAAGDPAYRRRHRPGRHQQCRRPPSAPWRRRHWRVNCRGRWPICAGGESGRGDRPPALQSRGDHPLQYRPRPDGGGADDDHGHHHRPGRLPASGSAAPWRTCSPPRCGPLEVMLGKIVPYILVGYLQMTVILLAARYLFQVPLVGNILLLFAVSLLFIAANLGVGLTFSTLARNQLQAMQMSFFFFLPSILLSGFMFPFRGMPHWAQHVGRDPSPHPLPAHRPRHPAQGERGDGNPPAPVADCPIPRGCAGCRPEALSADAGLKITTRLLNSGSTSGLEQTP